MKPIILIDFDHTLFDTQKLKTKHGSYHQIVDYVTSTQDNLDEYLYPDSLTFLKSINKEFTPAIFSEAQLEFQQHKINKTKSITNLVSKEYIFIYPPRQKLTHLGQVTSQLKPLVLIDDKSQFIDAAIKLGLNAIHLIRPNLKRSTGKYLPSFTVSDLTTILTQNLLSKLNQPLTSAKNIYAVGIKGVGMTAVALALQGKKKNIVGCDSKAHQITDPILEETSIKVDTTSKPNLPKNTDLIVYSGAYQPHKHSLIKNANRNHIPRITQAEALAHLVKGKKQIAVSGVGGKTTTTSLLVHIFNHSKQHPSWFVGTSRINKTLPPGKYDSVGKHYIYEADEYAINPPVNTHSKLSLFRPDHVICTNLTFDHPDVYSSFKQTKKTFFDFFNQIKPSGYLLLNHQIDLPGQIKTRKDLTIETFGPSKSADWTIEFDPSTNHLQITHQVFGQTELQPKIPGLINALNITSALAISLKNNLDKTSIVQAINNFSSLKRRQELIRSDNNIDYYDDYAHHPHEIVGVISAFKNQHPKKRLIVVFQPHTYSRTKSLLKDFAHSFNQADYVIIADIFSSARENQDISINSQILVDSIKKNKTNVHYLPTFAKIASHIKSIRKPGDIIISIGAGDIYQIHDLL